MNVSVVVTVRNEERSIDALLDSLLAQTRAPDEIVIADGGSTDATPAIIRRRIEKGAPIRLICCPGTNIAAGRNRAIDAATGEIIACTDAGVWLDSHWLERIIAPFQHGADVSMGFFVADARSTFECALGATTLPDVDEIDPDRFIPSSRSIAYCRRAWAAVGGYPEWLDYCEDVVFDLALRRAGFRFAWVPEAIAYFRPRSSVRAYIRQYYLYARGDGKANLWPRRHAIRYATYFLIAPLVLIAGFWYKPAWLALALGASVYLHRPYRRLARAMRRGSPRPGLEKAARGTSWRREGWSAGRARTLLAALVLIPFLRGVGDLAKMIGYPAGVWWRIRRGEKRCVI
jgi:glycosyltransferase involved in cell wall biosynthesis